MKVIPPASARSILTTEVSVVSTVSIFKKKSNSLFLHVHLPILWKFMFTGCANIIAIIFIIRVLIIIYRIIPIQKETI